MKLLSFLITVILLSSCGSEQPEVKIPEDVLHKDSMARILVDIFMLDAYLNQKQINSEEKKLQIAPYYHSVFSKYHVDQQAFDRSFTFYSSHPDLMNDIYKEAQSEVSRREAHP